MHACLHARHKAVPARGTVWVICVRSVEHQRVGRKLVDIGRVHIVSVAVRLELRPQIVADEQQDILPAGLVISGRAAASKQPRVSYAKLAHSWPRVLQHVSRLAPGAGKELLCQQPTALERGARARASPRVYTRVHGRRDSPRARAPRPRTRARRRSSTSSRAITKFYHRGPVAATRASARAPAVVGPPHVPSACIFSMMLRVLGTTALLWILAAATPVEPATKPHLIFMLGVSDHRGRCCRPRFLQTCQPMQVAPAWQRLLQVDC